MPSPFVASVIFVLLVSRTPPSAYNTMKPTAAKKLKANPREFSVFFREFSPARAGRGAH